MDPTTSGDPKKNSTKIEKISEREVVVTRSFDAPAGSVFEAWTDAALFRRWWVPRSMGIALHACEMDVRTGGSYRLSFGEGMDFFGTYVEVLPPSRIVWTNEEGGENGPVTTVSIAEDAGRTTVIVHDRFPSKEAFDADGGGGSAALEETFGQLEELLVELQS